MLVEFTRSEESYDGEDEVPQLKPISIAKEFVSAIFEAERPGHVIIRLASGRGFSVRGTYPEIKAKLNGFDA